MEKTRPIRDSWAELAACSWSSEQWDSLRARLNAISRLSCVDATLEYPTFVSSAEGSPPAAIVDEFAHLYYPVEVEDGFVGEPDDVRQLLESVNEVAFAPEAGLARLLPLLDGSRRQRLLTIHGS